MRECFFSRMQERCYKLTDPHGPSRTLSRTLVVAVVKLCYLLETICPCYSEGPSRVRGKGLRYQVLTLYTRHNFCTGPIHFVFTQLSDLERFEQTPTSDYKISPPDSEIFRSGKVAISRHRTGVSSDIARERNQPKRVVVAWKKCEICVYKKFKNCVSLVKTSNKIENFQKSEKVKI